jgi:hypothetical protein
MLQVLLLPNFTMMVAAELRKYNGIDTVDLFEQVILSHMVCAFNAHYVLLVLVFKINKEEYRHI